MKNYYRVMLGKQSAYIDEALKGGFIGGDFDIKQDLTQSLPENWREFNKEFIPTYLENNPGKSKVAAGLACGMLWTIAKGIAKGDIILSPDGKGNYFVAEVTGDYEYHSGEILPHRRPVKWYQKTISRDEMSESLRNSAGSIATVSNITKYSDEIEEIIAGGRPTVLTTSDETVENPSMFALEEHLEEFLVKNWQTTELGKKYDIYQEEGEIVGQQFPSDTGPIDILAISKDKKEIVVIELKKGRLSDVVVGQVQRYMGYIKEELSEEGQKVKGIIIGFEDDIKIKRALSVTDNIEYYTYKVHFRLEKIK